MDRISQSYPMSVHTWAAGFVGSMMKTDFSVHATTALFQKPGLSSVVHLRDHWIGSRTRLRMGYCTFGEEGNHADNIRRLAGRPFFFARSPMLTGCIPWAAPHFLSS